MTHGRFIAITGIDGSGKSTLSAWLQDELVKRGYQPVILWSRFNNYLSLPFLAVTRLTGHNYYETNNGVRMGYHNFEQFPVLFKWLFILLQSIDVNIATLFKLVLPSRKSAVTICERGPWDTFVDVISDTDLDGLITSSIPDIFVAQLSGRTDVILIERDLDLIYSARSEMMHDVKLERRKLLYQRLAEVRSWTVLKNNSSLEITKERLGRIIDNLGY